jgi:Cu/Ag efflux pump CusA
LTSFKGVILLVGLIMNNGTLLLTELQRPLALAVIGGLFVSMPVTLLIVPVLLHTFGELRS